MTDNNEANLTVNNTVGGATSDTITVGSQIYTFVAAGAAVAGNEVALGGSVNQTLLNLIGAVNIGGTGGTDATYSTTATAAGTATMSVGAGGSATVTATRKACRTRGES